MYEKPQLERLGTLRELTKLGFSSIPGDGIFMWSHAPQDLSGGGGGGGGGGLEGGGGGGLEGGGGGGPYLS